jgi:hypothetical protein
MAWALLNVHLRGRRIEEAAFAVFHDRSDLDERELDLPALVDDIRGYALYSTLHDLMDRWPGLEGVSDEAALFARERYQKYLVERLAAFVLSFHRARGAARGIRTCAVDARAWWQAEPAAQAQAARLAALADRVLALLSGLDHLRNSLVAQADAVVAIGGGAGTLTEIGLAWIYRRLIVALRVEGWSGELADRRIDERIRHPDIADDRVFGASHAVEAADIVTARIGEYGRRHSGIRSRGP